MLNGVASGRIMRGDLDFATDQGQVGVDGAQTDDEMLSNLCVGPSLRKPPQYLYCTGSQVIRRGGERSRWKGWVDDDPAGVDTGLSLIPMPPELVPLSCCGPRPWLRQRPFPPVALGRQLPPVHRWDDRWAARASSELHAELQPFPRAAPPR